MSTAAPLCPTNPEATKITTKRILLVEDQNGERKLPQILGSLAGEWEIDFAETGERAIEALAAADYDVVLTDMRLAEMDGAELLGKVKAQAPRAIRIVFSGGAAQEQLAMKCLGLAHHCLSKPKDAESFKRTIRRVTQPEVALRTERVAAVVGGLKHLPTLPGLYSRIVRLLDDPATEMADVGGLIAGDMAMTAKVLQIVNSPYFGFSHRVTDPAEAAAFLGVDTLKAVVLAANVFGQFEARKMPRGFSVARAADHSQSVAAAARAIARAAQASRQMTEEAFVAGLLHDVGELLLASSLPELFETGDRSSVEAERATFGVTHSEVGGYLLGLWGLPAPVVEAIRLHHSPTESNVAHFSALTAVHVAECLVTDRTVLSADMEYLVELGFSKRLPAWARAVHELFSAADEVV